MKTLLKSKTFWVNIVAIAVMLIQAKYGFVIDAEAQLALLAVINLVLRAVTKEEIVWEK
jgi:uncharacterized membrane protein